MENMTESELLSKYQNFVKKVENFNHYPMIADYENFKRFYNGMDCTDCISIMHRNSNPIEYTPSSEEQQVAYFSRTDAGAASVGIIAQDRKTELGLQIRYDTPTDRMDEYPFHVNTMQSAPEGIYQFWVNGYSGYGTVNFWDNELIKSKWENGALRYSGPRENLPLEEIKHKFIQHELMTLDYGYHHDFRITNCSKKDSAQLANLIHRKGMTKTYELLKNADTLDATQLIEGLTESYEQAKEPAQTAEVEETSEKTAEVSSPTITGAKRDEVAENLLALKNLGIELSPEQKAIVDLHERLNSDKFKQYKENSEARKERQEQVRKEISAENERKAEWLNSEENSTAKRKAELERMKKQIEALKALQNVDASLLSDSQQELIEQGPVFLDMVNAAKTEEHEVDTGMSPEMREWYQQHYTQEEGRSRK